MNTFTVALLQMAPAVDGLAAVTKGSEWCRRAAAQGADLALFPEMWDVGYQIPRLDDETAVDAWLAQASSLDGPYVSHFRRLAAELGMAIAVTYLEEAPARPRNSMAVIDRHGHVILNYAKVHTCEWDREGLLQPGGEFLVGTLDTERSGPVQVGAMICFDREHPESARVLMLQGAEIILCPNACELEWNRINQFAARAFENMVGVAMANYAAPAENGHSVAFDGMAFTPDGRRRDMLLAEGAEGEQLLLARFDLDALRDYREREVWGNAFRRVDAYQALVDPSARPPFARRRHDPGE